MAGAQTGKVRTNAWLDKGRSYDPQFVECTLDTLSLFPDRQIWYRVAHKGFQIDLFAYIRADARHLILSGQDAVQRQLVTLPYFYRWSWHADTDASFVTLNDPTLYLNDKLDGGWHQGYKEAWALDAVQEVLSRIAELAAVPPERTLLYGISAGGFWALMSATAFPGSTVVVEIPQVDLFRYEDSGPKAKMLLRCYKGKSIDYVQGKYPTRMRVLDRWKGSQTLPARVWIFHNLKDYRNTRTQIEPFWDEVLALRREGTLAGITDLQFRFYNRLTPKGGHIPMEKEDTLAVWRQALEGMA